MGPTLLAHAGAGATWQSLVSAVALALVLVVALVASGRVELRSPGDLVLPLAGVAILSSLAPFGSAWLSDWIGWAAPVGTVALLALLVGALTPLRLSVRGPLVYGAAALAVVAAVVLHQPLTVAWHPPPEALPDPGETSVEIVEPADGDQRAPGEVTVEVRVHGGSLGGGRMPTEELPADPTRQGVLEVIAGGERVDVEYDRTCTASDPCETVRFPVELPGGEDVGLQVELLRGDGLPFSPPVLDRVELDVG